MQDLYRPQGEYRPQRSSAAMIVAALMVGSVGLLGAAAAAGILHLGASDDSKSVAQSKLELSKAEAQSKAAIGDLPQPSEQATLPETPASQPESQPGPSVKAEPATPPSTRPTAKKAATVKPALAARQAGNEAATCANCGAVESIRMVKSEDAAAVHSSAEAPAPAEAQTEDTQAVSYRIQIRMEDGSLRTVVQDQAPAVAQGERVKIVDGMVVRGS